MGKGRDAARQAPARADGARLRNEYRSKTGDYHRKVGRTENRESVVRAIARKQPFPTRQVLLGLTSFAALSSLLYMYLKYVFEDDDA